MVVLAVDHGAARSGCAICDPSGTIVRPLTVVEPTNAEGVARVAAENSAEMIVVGLPVSLDGAEGAQADAARAFAKQLEQAADMPVETWDERLTTRLASASKVAGASAAPDALAAAHLLESYLARRAPA